jgi:hypothetical protein
MFSFEVISETCLEDDKKALEKAWFDYIGNKPLNPQYNLIETFNPSSKGYISFDLKCSLKKDFRTRCSNKRLFRFY